MSDLTSRPRRVDWNYANRKHVLDDHPDRNLSEAEIEEVLTNPNAIEEWDADHGTTVTLARTRAGRALVVAWTLRDGACYPVHARPAGRAAKENLDEGQG